MFMLTDRPGTAWTPSRLTDHLRRVQLQLRAPELAAPHIAGKVSFDGQPVAGAAVALHLAMLPDLAIADVVTRADGTFELPARPDTGYVVTANAPDHSPAIVRLDTGDPHAALDTVMLALGDCTWRTIGIVTDAEGAGIPHAAVRIDAVVGVETDANGRYELCRPPGASLVTVSSTGYGRMTAELVFRGTVRRDFTLATEAILFGRVTAAGTRGAIEGARVIAVSADNTTSSVSETRAIPAAATRTTSNGGFQITGLPPGRFRVEATADGLGSDVMELHVEPGASSQLEIVLAPRSRVHGRVVASGVPVSGAQVTMVEPHHPDAAIAWSAPDGSFVIDGAPRGSVRWQVRDYDVAPSVTTRIDRDDVAGVVLDVSAAASIRGRVTAGAIAVAGVEVSCTWADWSHGFVVTSQTVYSDSRGSYIVHNAASGDCLLEAHSSSLGARAADRTLHVASGSATYADVDLALDAMVSGVVVDPHGMPVATAYVRLEPQDGGDTAGDAMTDAAGTFTIRGLGAGDYRAFVSPSPIDAAVFPPAAGGGLAMIRIPGAHIVVSGLRLAINPERATLGGKVVDDHDLPIAGVRVQIEDGSIPPDATSERRDIVVKTIPPWFRPNLGILRAAPTTMTDDDGHFALRDLAPGHYNVRAFGADGASAIASQVAAGGAETTIRLPRAGAIDGTLIEFADAATVVVTDHRYKPQSAVSEGGRFSIRGLAPGTYSVVAQDATGADARVVEVRAGSVSRADLRSRGTGRIAGQVVELDTGAPSPGVRCIAAPAAGGFAQWWTSAATAVTDDAGRFILSPVPAGAVHVECLSAGHARAQREVVVPRGGEPASIQLASVPWPVRLANPGFRMLNEQLPPTVAAVDPGSPAALAGLAIGDTITELDGRAVDRLGSGGIAALLAGHPAGTTAKLMVTRGTTRFEATLAMP